MKDNEQENTEIKIDKSIPPPIWERAKGFEKYPFSKLEIGDSFLFPAGEVGNRLSQAAKRTGFKFSSRTVEGGCRIWRIK